MELNKTYHVDCLEGMKEIPDKSIDMILCDLPYGTTACKWDVVIPFEPLWDCYERIIKDNGAIVLTASQPFTSVLVTSNLKLFRYEWIWEKSKATGHLSAHKMPMKIHENICIFYKALPVYNPEGLIKGFFNTARKNRREDSIYIGANVQKNYEPTKIRNYPKTIIKGRNPSNEDSLHPTQKPVALFEYLIKTYTNEGEIVLDNCAGSGTTAIACINTNRNYILMEKEEKYYNIILERIKRHTPQLKLIA